MDDLVRDFVAEARESLEALDTDLVAFERNPDDPALLGRIFRLVHTIKGTAGFVGLERLGAVAHAAENVLGGVRDGVLPVTAETVSAVLEAVDVIGSVVDALDRTGAEPAGDDGDLIRRLDAACEVAPATAPEPRAAEPVRALIDRLGGDATADAACEGVATGLALPDGADPVMLQFELKDALCDQARGRGSPRSPQSVLTSAGLSPDAAAIATASLKDGLLALGAEPAAVSELFARWPEPAQAAEPDVLFLDDLGPAPAPIATAAPIAASAPAAAPAPAKTPSRAAVADDAPAPVEGGGSQTIRVGVDALEHLMTVASELVLIRNQLLQTLREQPESPFAAPLHRLNQVTTELQESVMTTRMQPISGAWTKLPRIVRDLAHELGKDIELVAHGQDTELDRQVLELIKDPLTHMIRNAADHGLETPSERVAAGKSPTGRITLSARHEGGAIVIEIADDGRGLNAARIRAKVVEKGLLAASAAEHLSDAEARQFIFAAGFSTAAQVTAVSGRGVGMDVVKTNIERIGGTVEVGSVEGEGTRFTIRIPLTLTIVSALIVECAGMRFAMPQSSVVELVGTSGASGKAIETVGDARVLRLRDRLLPLVSLQRLLGLPECEAKRDQCIIVAKVGSFTFGVIVDRVYDTEEIVVKPVSAVLRHVKLYSGATILGDGSVIMILDFKGMAAETGAGAAPAEAEDAIESAREATQSLLVFRSANGGLKAAPLADVARIEDVDGAQLEFVDGRSVVQYRDRLMPVVAGPRGEAAEPFEGRRPMLVFSRRDQAAGLLVAEIVDICEAVVTTDLDSAGEGSLGSLIVGGSATELIDVDRYWARAVGTAEPAAPVAAATAFAAPAPASAAEARRLLIVDDSPFARLLLQPLLAQAGYQVTVATDPGAALSLHERGDSFELILADTSGRSTPLPEFAQTFARARRWHKTPLLGLGLHVPGEQTGFDRKTLLDAVSGALTESEAA